MACCGARRNADLISVQFQVGLETVLGFQQAAIVIAPSIAFVLTRRILLRAAEEGS
jgi:hypothetical protein